MPYGPNTSFKNMKRFVTICPSLAATKHTRPPLKKVPFSEPKADNAAATDMIHPQLPNTLFLWRKDEVHTQAETAPFKRHLPQAESIPQG